MIAPKVAPVERFAKELREFGFDADQIRLVSVAMSRAGVMLEDKPGGNGSRMFPKHSPDTALQSVQIMGDSKYRGGIESGRGLSIGGDL